MQATITYLLTEQAQRAAIAATGQPVPRKQTVTEDIPNEWAQSDMVTITATGEALVDLARDFGLNEKGERTGVHGYAVVRAASGLDQIYSFGLEAIQAVVAAIEHKSAELKESYAQTEVVRAERDREAAERRAAAEVEAANRKAAEEAKEQAKRDYIDRWIADHADTLTREQHGTGLLCRKTTLSLIAQAAFAEVGMPDEQPDSIVCRSQECPCHDKSIDCIPRSIYPAWRELAKVLPNGYTVDFRAVRDCLRDDEDHDGADETATDMYYAAVVTMPVGPFVFERRIRLG